MPDQPYLPEKLTAREFLEYIAGLYQLDWADARRRGDELLKLFDWMSAATSWWRLLARHAEDRWPCAAA